MSAWGRTGRVEIRGDINDPRALPSIYVDSDWVGWLYTPDDHQPKWGARSCDPSARCDDLPSLDAAVMWVLRRAAPDVWRAERGPVCLVRWCPEAKPYPWHLFLPGGQMLANAYGHHAWAMTDGRTAAAELAREAT